jgi:uncharacterized protein YciI
MLFAVLFEDNDTGVAEVRNHQNEDTPAGGLWLVEADTPDAVDELVRNDPFWPTSLRRSARVLAWKQVYADGARLGA